MKRYWIQKYNAATSTGSFLPPGRYEFSDINLMVKSSLTDEVTKSITTDCIRPRSTLNTNKTRRLFEKFFRYTVLGFTQSHS